MTDKTLRSHKTISLLITIVGLALMTFMILVEDEPGAIPLALIAAGTGWYFYTRSKYHTESRKA